MQAVRASQKDDELSSTVNYRYSSICSTSQGMIHQYEYVLKEEEELKNVKYESERSDGRLINKNAR